MKLLFRFLSERDIAEAAGPALHLKERDTAERAGGITVGFDCRLSWLSG